MIVSNIQKYNTSLVLVCLPRWCETSLADTGLLAYANTVLADLGWYGGRHGFADSGIHCESSKV